MSEKDKVEEEKKDRLNMNESDWKIVENTKKKKKGICAEIAFFRLHIIYHFHIHIPGINVQKVFSLADKKKVNFTVNKTLQRLTCNNYNQEDSYSIIKSAI